ncbi:BZ3500_MvSof-1268-A1-R1_Chr6-2g08571 [Microbotryum saponariae]|uniref:BZ3500_MvSof-1268-A1-R1_Chr6-2g08571 protein n=1 Tax=Microbotryum saponariae TaxID=289078 RepID=A0A2X0NNR4_9BASI|nr:BZ3500_MvSof-1268-A1-R1_Chr6-2g08571 [Microbotryum saponariae]SDA07846.1 BZ3501_MvSof-1269-A2-R1_Chr6-1g08283 [Microbotryum saponariae]
MSTPAANLGDFLRVLMAVQAVLLTALTTANLLALPTLLGSLHTPIRGRQTIDPVHVPDYLHLQGYPKVADLYRRELYAGGGFHLWTPPADRLAIAAWYRFTVDRHKNTPLAAAVAAGRLNVPDRQRRRG